MTSLKRTNSNDKDFQKLVRALDAELAIYNGDQNEFYSQFNTIQDMAHTLVVYNEDLPIGSGAIKPQTDSSMEIKRMYVLPEYRGAGIASQILKELESWSVELGYKSCVLETGKFLKPAVALYQSQGYIVIPNYGQYTHVEESVCFEKRLV